MATHLHNLVGDEPSSPGLMRGDNTFGFARSSTVEWLAQCGETAFDSCTPFFKAVKRGSPGAVTCVLVILFCVLFVGQMIVKDERVDIKHLIPPGALCANQEDMYDVETKICQLRNKFAYAYLLGHSWVYLDIYVSPSIYLSPIIYLSVYVSIYIACMCVWSVCMCVYMYVCMYVCMNE